MDKIREAMAGAVDAWARFLEREAGHACVFLLLMWWGCQLMAMHVDFGQRLMDQAMGALFYAMNVRRDGGKA